MAGNVAINVKSWSIAALALKVVAIAGVCVYTVHTSACIHVQAIIALQLARSKSGSESRSELGFKSHSESGFKP